MLQQLDWIGKVNGTWVIFEVKDKELWEPGDNFPVWGTGLNRSQIFLRSGLLEECGFQTFQLVYVKDSDVVYGAYLDELENQGGYHDTTKSRIYPIEHYSQDIEGTLRSCRIKI
ncbi:hypothetical protein ACFLYV_00280 [Chloroflexota bacterium]